MHKKFLIFGASGTIGGQFHSILQADGTIFDAPRKESLFKNQIEELPQLDGVIWAQGVNTSDSISSYNEDILQETLESNALYILRTAHLLLANSKLKSSSQLVIISSMWAQYARPEKLSYSISKAATSAVARSLAVDLGPLGIQVNAISPGPIDSPMTRKNLSREQVERITSEAPLKRFVSLDEVVRIASKFAMGDMSGITGQDILVDAGWSVSKLV
jgi:NAD(P)-dependent dehydrogenase (short-subunit alcohol dehydrogenase family)